ncbi:MAG TPA: SpoIIE family protein phosphatase [Vicinamibacterales bacterium]|nr:SpoIIE family protein phosphatase [Vicinamibacterales bacterium]
MNTPEGVRGALFHTLPGRGIVVGLAIKLAVALIRSVAGTIPAFLAVIETVASLAVAIGLSYFAFRLIVLAKRRLLWRVRRKLILSFIFVGFVPALLLAAFALLCGFLLFYNLSAYLVQSRLRTLSDQARFYAQATALELQRVSGPAAAGSPGATRAPVINDAAQIVARRQASIAAQYPDASVAVLATDRDCRASPSSESRPAQPSQPSSVRPVAAGPWRHVAVPEAIPSWVPCAGFAGVLAYTHPPDARDTDTHLLVRAVVFAEAARPPFAVVVDLMVNDALRRQLRRDTGVELKTIVAVDSEGARPLVGVAGDDPETAGYSTAGALSSLPSPMEFQDWNNGAAGTLMVTNGLSVAELYDRISAAEGRVGRNFGQGLLLVLFVIGALFLIIQFIALVAGLALAKSITGSVHALFTGTERVRQGDFTHKIAVVSDDQLGELAGSFNEMTASIEDLLRQAAEKKRLEEELRIAHEIQMSLLPQGPLLMPGLSVTALCVPAREVGGDYYDFLPLDDHRVGVLIADVSGKGTSAALYMAELKGLMLSLSQIHSSPRELLIVANRIIAQHLDARSFITMTYAVIDMRARTMTYARAGHTPLIYVPGCGSLPGARSHAKILAPDGLVLGLKIDRGELFEQLLQEETIFLGAGDLYLFFTDGISEAMNVQDDCFGEGRLGQLVESHAHLPPDELRERVLREISAFVGEAPQHDDMTMILLKVDEVSEAVA